MRQRRVFVLAAALLMLCAAMATAQGGRGFGLFGRQGGLQMLRTPEVQKELKMTPEQIGKLDAAQQTVRDGMQGLFQGGYQNLSAAERQQRTDKMQELNDTAATGLLDATQLKRYHQLELQQQGPAALARKSIAADLKLTDDQQKKLADIQTQADADRRAAMQGQNFQDMTDADRQAMFAKMQTAQKASGDKILALLTDAQKAQWKDMQGAAFTFPTPAPPGAPAAPAAPVAAPTPAAPAA